MIFLGFPERVADALAKSDRQRVRQNVYYARQLASCQPLGAYLYRTPHESYAIVRDTVRADRTDEDALRSVKAHASFKGMQKDLARWPDDVGLAPVLRVRSCAELFHDSRRERLHTTSAARYPVFVRKRDGSLTNYSGSSPELTRTPGYGA